MLRPPACLSALARNFGVAMATLAATALTSYGGVLYQTGFEATESPPFAAGVGTVLSAKLVGTGNWAMAVNPTPGTLASYYPFAGIDSGLVLELGQTAALGCLDHTNFTMPPSGTQSIRVGRKVDAQPAGNPVIDFYCQIGLTQSTNGHSDDFELLVYNWDDKVLGGLTFDLAQNKLLRYNANEYNTGSTDSAFTDTGLSLSSLYGTVVEVTMHVNYQTDTWSATVSGVQVAGGATFTRRPTASAARTFGSVQARWYINSSGVPGNNWMLFNDWTITDVTPSLPATASAGYAANSTAGLTVTDADSVGWAVSSDQTWAVVSPASGSGSATVTVTCAANPSATTRTARITVGAQTCVLTQAAAPAVTSIPATASAAYPANSTASLAVTSNTSWSASSNQVWAVVSPASGSGNGTVTVTCALNATATTRAATITIGTQTCQLTQAASPFAVWAVALPTGQQGFAQDVDRDGVTNGMEYAMGRNAASSSGINGIAQLPVVTVSGSAPRRLTLTLRLPDPAPADIVYDIQAANGLTGAWTVIMEKSGTGSWAALGNSGATVVSSTDGSGRTAFAISDAQGYRFLRLGVTSSSVVDPVTTVPAAATALYSASSTAVIAVISNSGWMAASDQAWAVVSPSTATGNSTVTVTCAANAGLARTATITIGGQTCVVTQAAAPFATWAAALPAAQQGFAQDADSDGVGNGMEYALGRNATSGSGANGASQMPVLTWTGSGTARRPALAVNLATTAPADVTYDVEASDNLTGSWTSILGKSGNNPWTVIGGSGATVSSAVAGTGRMLHTVTDPLARHFLRLRVTKDP